jgi:hypothetical protein
MGAYVSALAISARCHCYGIILKSPKREGPSKREDSALVTQRINDHAKR